MEDYFASIIFGSMDIRLLSIMIVTGFLIFIMYFYRSELWSSFSDFDKLSFSITCGFIVLLGFVIPLARIIFALTYFFKGYDFVKIESEEVIATYKQIYFFMLPGLFILSFISPKPLYDNAKIFKKIFVGYIVLVFFISLLAIELALAIMFSQFRDYSTTLYGNISLSIFFMILFFGVYLAVHKKSNPAILKEVKLFFLEYRMKKKYFFILLILLVFLPYVFGTFLFSYKVTENEDTVEFISIKEIDIVRNEMSSGKELIHRDYSIKMPILVSWVKIKPDLVLKNSKLEDETDSSYTVLKDENAFVVNKTSKVVNVTVSLYKDTEATYSKMVSLEDPAFTNDSIFVNVSLTNYLPHNVEIETLIIPISDGYTLTENDFVKTQFFANYRGGIQGYTVENETLILTYVRLEKNASGTIDLRLTEKDV